MSHTHWAYPQAHSESRHERMKREWRPFFVGKREAAARRFAKHRQHRHARRATRRGLRALCP